MKKFLRGATSFYIVAFATLLLIIIAASFATVILSELGRTSNDDLSQSAYDSALAGVEDAKLAYSNYLRCVESNSSSESCTKIVNWMKPENINCNMVANILGRDQSNGEVTIRETSTTESDGDVTQMNQAYTCVQIKTRLSDYRANLTADNNVRLIKAQFADGVSANDIAAIQLSWYANTKSEVLNFTNYDNGAINWSPDKVTFQPVGANSRPSTPPTLSVQLVQTSDSFVLGGYNDTDGVNSMSNGTRTDRATLFLVPTNDTNINGSGFVHATSNVISAADVAKTNDQAVSHQPFVVRCNNNTGSADFLCSVKIMLPDPVGSGVRNNDTFMMLVTLPYGEPDTEFGVDYICKSGSTCSAKSENTVNGEATATLDNMQVTIDSTGRANDLFRRVETRLESTDTSFPYTYYALEMFGEGMTLMKNMTVTCEGNFYDNSYNNSLDPDPRGRNC